MKKIICISIFTFFLSACNTIDQTDSSDSFQNSPSQIPTSNENTDSESESVRMTTETVQTVPEGEMCGGPDNIRCAPGFECITENNIAFEEGVCVSSIVNDQQCEKTQKPVCGLKNGRHNAYLNECEAQRHGAKIITNQFCKRDQSIVGSCQKSAQLIGDCNSVFEVFLYDGSVCKSQKMHACDVVSPFSSLEECQNTCLKS